MPKHRVDVVNQATGESHQGFIVWTPTRPKVQRFFMGFQEAFKALACDTELTPQAQRVILYLLGELDFENYIHLKQKDLGEALGIGKSNLSRAISLLKRKQIILEAPYKGVRCYRLNHYYGWKGSVTSLKQVKQTPLEVIQGGKP